MENKRSRNRTLRQRRKEEHIRLALTLPDGPGKTGLAEIGLLPEAMPDLDLADIDISTSFCGYQLSVPILINAVTGGTPEAARINARLAMVAKEFRLALAVGSLRAALEDPSLAYTFTIVRRIYPDAVLFANLGAGCTPEEARRAVGILQAQGLQLHLNAAQELNMAEGDRAFHWSRAIESVVQDLPVPVIVKEVGSGMTGQTARRLVRLGVKALDVGGKGGTNFVAIEEARRVDKSGTFLDWGLPTAWSLLDILAKVPPSEGVDVCAAGGLRNGLDMAKSLALGARVCGVAGPLLKAVVSGGVAAGLELVRRWQYELKVALVLCGAKNLHELAQKPLFFYGDTLHWVRQRQLSIFLHRTHS